MSEAAIIALDDPRLEATLEYNADDDGIWIVYGGQCRCLGFGPSVLDVLEECRTLKEEK